MDVLVSDKHMPFSLGLNTGFSTISLVSTDCNAPTCDVAHRYDESLSKTVKSEASVPISQDAMVYVPNYLIYD